MFPVMLWALLHRQYRRARQAPWGPQKTGASTSKKGVSRHLISLDIPAWIIAEWHHCPL
jgi:hypothetical protein